MVAADKRADGTTRKKCDRLLQALRPGLITSLALGADYGSETLRFLRQFEGDFDCACLSRWLAEFKARMSSLFVEARIFQELPDAPDEEQSCSLLSLVIELCLCNFQQWMVCRRMIKLKVHLSCKAVACAAYCSEPAL